VRTDGKQWIAQLEAKERQRTGIASLKVGYNAVFGYYLEVSKPHLNKVPPDYIRKQTLANAERFITPELKEQEAILLGAEERINALEFELFSRVRNEVARCTPQLQSLAKAIAELDVLCAFAENAVRYRYVRPVVDTEDRIHIVGGRHPVVERFSEKPFVPNDCRLDPTQRLIILTGPNMSGKSTYIRQNALITLMAHIGSFVPAERAEIGLVDRIFTRVGARDELATGQSTFMVEMTETANILNNATPRSLVILDEIGRGTSTYDGLAIAWAVAEYLHAIGCKTLFATHYHYLNELANRLEGVANYRVAVKEQGDRIVWLHKVLPGGTDRSYGVHVARMAGVPPEVVQRAEQILREFERRGVQGAVQPPTSDAPTVRTKKLQLTLFEAGDASRAGSPPRAGHHDAQPRRSPAETGRTQAQIGVVGYGTNTAAPRILPARNACNASFACSSGKGVGCVCTVNGRMRSKNAAPSSRVRFATERTTRSPHRIAYGNDGMSLMWMPPHTTTPPLSTARSAAGTNSPTGANRIAPSSGSGGIWSEPPAHHAPSPRA
jgi:DNA mismatch repair protein MutS